MARKPSGKYVYKPGDTKHQHTWRECEYCGERYLGRVDSKSRFCSLRCSGKTTGKKPRPAATQDNHLVCTRCGSEKPYDDFGRFSRSPTGRKPQCRACRAEVWVTTRTPELLARMREDGKRRWAENPEIMRERSRRQVAKYREANRDLVRAQARERYRKNPQARKITEQRRRAQKRRVSVLEVTSVLLAAKWKYWGGLCWICRGEADTWDHVKPLAKGGYHCLANLRPACRSCNCKKHATWPYTITTPQRQAA